jgi:hypothetical protein
MQAARKPRSIPADPAEYSRVLARVRAATARWPNAYASGRVVQEYKAAMAAKGLRAYLGFKPRDAPLARWYSEDWIDISTGLPCGAARAAKSAAGKSYYPTCRPARRVTARTPVTAAELTAAEKKRMVAQKQKAQERTVHYSETKKAK